MESLDENDSARVGVDNKSVVEAFYKGRANLESANCILKSILKRNMDMNINIDVFWISTSDMKLYACHCKTTSLFTLNFC